MCEALIHNLLASGLFCSQRDIVLYSCCLSSLRSSIGQQVGVLVHEEMARHQRQENLGTTFNALLGLIKIEVDEPFHPIRVGFKRRSRGSKEMLWVLSAAGMYLHAKEAETETPASCVGCPVWVKCSERCCYWL